MMINPLSLRYSEIVVCVSGLVNIYYQLKSVKEYAEDSITEFALIDDYENQRNITVDNCLCNTKM